MFYLTPPRHISTLPKYERLIESRRRPLFARLPTYLGRRSNAGRSGLMRHGGCCGASNRARRDYLITGGSIFFMSKGILIIGILMLWSSNATAQGRLAVGHCIADLRTLCPGVPPGNNRLRACMRDHIHDVSDGCLVTLAKFAEVRRLHSECSAHLRQQCASVERGGGQFAACLRSAVASLSDTCKNALARAVRGAR
jgi:hypothetical protein